MSDLTLPMLKCIKHSLGDYLFETDRYLQGSHTTVPGPTDTCCEAHLEDWKRKDEIQRNLQIRRDGIVATLRVIDKQIHAIGKQAVKDEAREKFEKEKA